MTLPLQNDLFQALSSSIEFEEQAKGRKGNHLVKIEVEGVPLVRTTSKYNIAPHRFSETHDFIANAIINTAKTVEKLQNASITFNNALIEIYNSSYFKMKYHSDQCLDLDMDSYIALFSCYERPEEIAQPFLRKLKIRSKTTNEEQEFELEHNSVILFSYSTNTKYQHKIVLDASSNQKNLLQENRWLGITFRKSKTFLQFKDSLPYFIHGEPLKLANESQQSEFYKWRGQENKSVDFEYPSLAFTLSKGDMLFPK